MNFFTSFIDIFVRNPDISTYTVLVINFKHFLIILKTCQNNRVFIYQSIFTILQVNNYYIINIQCNTNMITFETTN